MSFLNLHGSPALRVCSLLIAGILIGRWCTLSMTTLLPLVILLLAITVFVIFISRKSDRCAVVLTVCTMGLCVALGAARITADAPSSLPLAAHDVEGPVVARGTITESGATREGGKRCIVAVKALLSGSRWIDYPVNVLVTVRRLRADTGEINLRYGVSAVFRGVLGLPSDERNPGEFNLRKYYEANGIAMLMRVKGFHQVAILDSAEGWWILREVVVPARQYMFDRINATIGGEAGEFLKGILIGERSGLSPATRQAFTNAGVSHVLAVSGSNVAVVAAMLIVVLEFFRLPRWMRVAATSTGLVFFMLLTGNQSPVVRATIMALVLLMSSLVQEKTSVYNSLGLSALIILLLDARQLFDVGFQLSFVAVLSIVHLYPIANRLITGINGSGLFRSALLWILRVCAVSAVATLGTLPLTALYFGRVSIIGLLANIVVIPAVGASVVLGSIALLAGMLSPWLADVYCAITLLLLRSTLAVTDLAGGLSWATVDALRFRPVDAFPFYCALLLVFHLRNPRMTRTLAILLLLALNVALFSPASQLHAAKTGKLRVSFIDVGQGDAVLAEFPGGGTMLVDAGPRSDDFDAGERVVTPFLKRRGISDIDLLVVTHADADHLGGVPHVLTHFNVKRVVENGQALPSAIYLRYSQVLTNQRADHGRVCAGMRICDFEGARLYVLFPPPISGSTDSVDQEQRTNTQSVVLKLQYGECSFLLVGDAERQVEEIMERTYGDFLCSTVLKVGHHGSRSGTSQEFLDIAQPTDAVISVGKFNRFNHPSSEVLQRLSEHHILISRTDEEGAVIFETDGRSISRVDWR